MSSVETVTPLLKEKIAHMGFELFDMRLFNAGSRSMLRITIDRPEGVTISDCEKVSHEVSVVLDVENFLDGRSYALEVSSPGIDRPLQTERDYLRIIGRDVSVHLRDGVDGKKMFRGEIVQCENNKLTLKIENTMVEIPLSDIFSGKEELRFK